MSHRTVGVALVGCGVVGSGVLRILTEQRELIAARTGLSFDIRHVVVRDASRNRGIAGLPLTTDARRAIEDPAVQVVVELIGGNDPAGELIQRALMAGKPVVTANKALLAARGRELFALARRHNASISFEASCGGGIPIIQALTHGLVANEISALVGIVNGTCNVILTRMTQNRWSYEQALAEAQRLGYAEADPTMDVSGRDAAQKLAILASLAFNANVAEADIHVEGIDRLDPQDIRFARELGYVIKLLAIAERAQGGDALSLRVHPTLVHEHDVLSDVAGSFNAISVYGHALGHCLFYGRGAGQMPTASAVVSDIIQTGLGTAGLAFKQLRVFPDATPPAKVLPFEQLRSRYYVRVLAKDAPGVMAAVATILGKYQVSISAILQHESDSNHPDFVPIVITTHLAREGDIQKALAEMNGLSVTRPPAACLRIIDQPKESSAIR
jgi:homoserine dehydrogenase